MEKKIPDRNAVRDLIKAQVNELRAAGFTPEKVAKDSRIIARTVGPFLNIIEKGYQINKQEIINEIVKNFLLSDFDFEGFGYSFLKEYRGFLIGRRALQKTAKYNTEKAAPVKIDDYLIAYPEGGTKSFSTLKKATDYIDGW